jgi:hypothetical protein
LSVAPVKHNSISLVLGAASRSGNTLTANLSCFNASCFRTWYECPPPRRGRERARQELPRPPLLAIPSRSSVTDTLSAERVLTPKALKGKLKRTRPRGYTEAPAGARGAKHCTVWMGVACALPSQSRNLLATICLDPQLLVYGAACTALGTVRSARRPRRGRWRGQLAERLAQETLGRREALVRVVGKEEVVMGREGRLSGDARALKVIEPRSVLL